MSHKSIPKYSKHQAIFEHIQSNGDVISSILILHQYLKDNEVDTTLDIEVLRSIALMSCDKQTWTHLWHINALIASSSNLESLLLGMEMMFNQYLGNKKSFQMNKHKLINQNRNTNHNVIGQEQKHNVSPMIMEKRNNNNRNKIISLVQSLYDEQDDDDDEDDDDEDEDDDDDDNDDEYDSNCSDSEEDNDENENNDDCEENDDIENRESINQLKPQTRITISCHDHTVHASKAGKNGRTLIVDNSQVDFNKEIISSPISFRLRQQKRMIQNDRRSIVSKLSLNMHDFDDEPIVHSPFNVKKLEQKVDRITLDRQLTFQ